MRMRVIVAVLIFAFAPLIARAEQATPMFSDYPVKSVKYKPAKFLDLDSFPHARNYRTRLMEGFKEPADFAQKYVVVMHGCGTECMAAWFINKETGKVVDEVAGTGYGFTYQIDSSLVIANGETECNSKEEGAEICEAYLKRLQTKYYIMKDDRLVPLGPYEVEHWK